MTDREKAERIVQQLYGINGRDAWVDHIAKALADERTAHALADLRCDDCDNGIEDNWDFCPWCGKHQKDGPPHESER
jgi:hypothetical protein